MLRRSTVLLSLLAACDGSTTRPIAGSDYAPECNPLGMRTERVTGPGIVTMQCALPYPSSVYEIPDEASPTGVRLDIPTEALPLGTYGDVDTTFYNRLSGFSAATRIVVEMPGGFDPSNLPFHTDIEASLGADSPTLIVDVGTGERVAHWAETDLLHPDPEKRVLLLHPANRLRGATRYAVGLRTSLLRADGSSHERPAVFQAVQDGGLSEHERFDRVRGNYFLTSPAMEKAGMPAGEQLLVWDFVTADDGDYVDDMVRVRDLAIEVMGEGGLGYEIEIVDDTPDQERYRRTLEGTVTVPWFLDSTNVTGKEGFLSRGADGEPAQNGESTARFKVAFPSNPDCYVGGVDMPVLLYGHGLFGDYHSIDSDGVERVVDQACVIAATTNWLGWDEVTRVGAIEALYDVSIANLPMERMMQGIVNFIVVGRTVTGLMQGDPSAAIDGVPVVRPGPAGVLYYGNSQGGIFGTTLMEYHPDVTRGVLGVPGGIYSLMLPRSVDWPLYEALFGSSYPDLADQRLLLSMFQSAFDVTDPAAAAPYLAADPERLGVGPKQLLFQAALGDSQVPNLSTENMVRTIGVPLLQGSRRQTWGLEERVDDVPSALVIYEVEGAELPPDTLAFQDVDDNGVHGFVRDHSIPVQQMARFLTGDGVIHDFCDPDEGCLLREE